MSDFDVAGGIGVEFEARFMEQFKGSVWNK